MTYEELLAAITERAMGLKLAAVRLLLHLITTAIANGTNEVRSTVRALAESLKCSCDKVAEAVDDLRPLVGVTTHKKLGHTFQLPAEWFSQSRGIFTDWSTVEKSVHCPGNQDSAVRETRTALYEKPGQSRRMKGEYQDSAVRETRTVRRMEGEYQDSAVLETRTVETQNQRVTGEEIASIDRSDSLVQLHSFRSIEQIACAKVVPPEQRSDAMALANAIRAHQSEFGEHRRDLGPVDEQIIARCLAVAPLGSLLSELKQMRIRAVRAGSSYAWYPSVFCQRLKGIPSNVLAAGLKACARHGHQRPQRNLDFSTQITADMRQSMRKIS